MGRAQIDGRPVMLLGDDFTVRGGSADATIREKPIMAERMAYEFRLPLIRIIEGSGGGGSVKTIETTGRANLPGGVGGGALYHYTGANLSMVPVVGLEAEKAATIRLGVRAMAAVNQTTVPWCTMIIRNAFGVAGVVHQPAGRLSLRYAWLSARWGSLPLEGGIEAAYRADLDAAPDRTAKMAEIEDRLNKLRSPFRSAESFWIEEIVDPRDTRRILCEFVELAAPVRGSGPSSHGMRP